MKIVHLILGKARIDRMNGINRVAHNLALYQKRLRADVEIWGLTATPADRPPPQPYGLRLFRHPRWGLDPLLKEALGDLLPSDRVHIHGSFIPAFRRVAGHLLHAGVPFYYCPHGSLSPGALARSKWKKKLYLKLRELKILRRACGIHLLGDLQYRFLRERFPDLPYRIIPNGQNLEELQFEPQAVERPAGFLIGYCGRLDIDHKGLDVLLDGLRMHCDRGDPSTLWLIGGGADEAWMRQRVQALGLQQQVKFWGPQFGEDKLNLLAQTDLFVHTSRYEGLPTAVLEAAGLGLPCLVSEPTNMGSALKRHSAGWLMEKVDAKSVADELNKAYAVWMRGDWEAYKQRAHLMIKTEYNWMAIARAMLDFYGTKQPTAY